MPIIFSNFAPDFIINLNLYFMKKLIIVEVLIKTLNPKEPFKKVFSRQVSISDDLLFPYNQIESSLSILFGSDSVISFSAQFSK